MDSRAVIKLLITAGWYQVAIKGSHHQFKHPTRPGRVTVIHPTKDFAVKTLISMETQSGVPLRRR